MNQLTYTTLRALPEVKVNTTNIQQLQLTVEYWQQLHAEAGSQKETAWREYLEAVDNSIPHAIINDMYNTCQLFEAICVDTWEEYEKAKKNLLMAWN